MNSNKGQKGQALILIALGMIGLVALTALAIDGGNSFSERRRAQNAADTSSLAGALEKVDDTLFDGTFVADGNGNGVNWLTKAQSLVTQNMSGTSGMTYTYDIPTEAGSNPVLPYPGLGCKGEQGPYYHNTQYIQVLIHINVDTYFGKVIGINSLQSCVEAIARADPPYVTGVYDGNVIVSLAPHECKAIQYQGGADTFLINGGIFVNSDCALNAFNNDSGHSVLTSPFLTSVGGVDYKAGNLNISGGINTGAVQKPYPPDFIMPQPDKDCGPRGTNPLVISGNTIGPDTTAGKWAGNWEGTFPPAGVTHLNPGLYCLYTDNGGFVIRNNDSLYGNGVTLAVMTGRVDWTGSNTAGYGIKLYAPEAPASCATDPSPAVCHYPYNGLLLFMPMTNTSSITFNGNAQWDLKGTVLAPASDITINGTEDGFSLTTQIIAYTIKLTGNGATFLNYDNAMMWDAQYPAHVELTQ